MPKSYSCNLSLVLLLSILACPERERKAVAQSFVWDAGELSKVEHADREFTMIGNLTALRFDAARHSAIDLSSEYGWHELTGPMTVRVVFRPTRVPREKTPLISKWHMTMGGRSFEVGLLSDGRPFFDISGSGNWDDQGRELVGLARALPLQPYCLAAVYDPNAGLSLYMNGRECGTLCVGIPRRLHRCDTPVLVGAQPPGLRWSDVEIAQVLIDGRPLTAGEISQWAACLQLTKLPTLVEPPIRDETMDLSIARRQILAYCDSLQLPGRPYGVVRIRDLPDAPVTLYASCDVAWTRACMGEDLTSTLTSEQRQQWIDHINSFARPDGTYENPNHSEMHRNGMVIGALAVLGGRQKYAVRLYDEFDELDEVEPWLERIRWDRQWSASHLFWGGMHCFSMSDKCSQAWRDRMFRWLDANLDPQSGWWRKGVPQAGGHIEVLGGAAHIWPVYQHHQRPFPYPRKVIDSILAMQQGDGSWLGFGNYMELDALYGLAYMHSLVPDYRANAIASAARRHGRLVQEHYAQFLSSAPDTHLLLAVVGTLALLQELDAEHFPDSVRWSDIFSDRRFYKTDRVDARRV